MKAKRNLAQKLLEKADNLQKDHNKQQQLFFKFILRITRQNLKRKLFKPTKINKEPISAKLEQQALQLPNPSPVTSSPNFENFNRKVRIRSPSTNILTIMKNQIQQNSIPKFTYRCFTCQSVEHLMYQCPQYRCKGCGQVVPGHRFRECPQIIPQLIDRQMGYVDIEGFDDGNLNGEN